MRILFLSNWYPTSKKPLHGVFIKEHAKAIKNAGIDITVLVMDIGNGNSWYSKNISRYTDENGIDTHVIRIESKFWKWLYVFIPFQYIQLSRYFKHIDAEKKFDIIHANVINPAGILGYWLAKRTHKKLIITEHWSKFSEFLGKSIFSISGKKAYAFASKITAVSGYLANLIEDKIRAKNTIIIPNTISEQTFSYVEKQLHHDELIFTAVSSWKKPKRPMLFINALTEIQKNIEKKIVLNLIGEGELIQDIKSINHNIQINYLGNCTKEKIAATLHQSNYFLHASSIETFSVVIAEALYTGTPVAASNVGAIPDLINESNGVLCDNTEDAWIRGISNLISTTFNHKEISLKASAKYNLTTVGTAFKDLYTSL